MFETSLWCSKAARVEPCSFAPPAPATRLPCMCVFVSADAVTTCRRLKQVVSQKVPPLLFADVSQSLFAFAQYCTYSKRRPFKTGERNDIGLIFILGGVFNAQLVAFVYSVSKNSSKFLLMTVMSVCCSELQAET